MEESSSVYQLLNNLAQDLLEKECLEKDNLYNNYEINDIAKRLRVKTFEILLKKTPHFSGNNIFYYNIFAVQVFIISHSRHCFIDLSYF